MMNFVFEIMNRQLYQGNDYLSDSMVLDLKVINGDEPEELREESEESSDEEGRRDDFQHVDPTRGRPGLNRRGGEKHMDKPFFSENDHQMTTGDNQNDDR